MVFGQNFTSFDDQRRQRGSNLNHHHYLHHNHQVHPNHILNHQINNQTPFNSQYLSPIARAYQHLTATLPNATQTHHFHHNNAFHNAKTCESLHEDDSLSSVSMLSSEQAKRKVRWILSLGLLLPALAAIIGVVAWAVSAEVVMGVQREAALKNQQNNHLGNDDFLLNQLETRKLTVNSDRLKLNKQNNRGFGDRLSLNVRPLASTESKEHLSSSKTNEITSNNEKNNTSDNSKFDEMDTLKNSLENQKLDNKIEQETKKDESENLQDVNLNENSNKKNESEIESLDEDTKNNDEDDKLDEKIDENSNDNLSENLKENLNENLNEEMKENLDENLNEKTKNKNFITSKTTSKSFKDKNGNEVKTFSQDISFNQSKSLSLENKDKLEKIDNLKKSAGAQVAEVIDKLVAQRNGVAPHIVVVAPFKLNDGKKKVTLTSGNVHEVPPYGSKSINAQSLISQLSKNQKDYEKSSNPKPKEFTILSFSTNKVTTTTLPTRSIPYKGRSMQEEETDDLVDVNNKNDEEEENTAEEENSKKNEDDTEKSDPIDKKEDKETLKHKDNENKTNENSKKINDENDKATNEKDDEEKSDDKNKEDQETSAETDDEDSDEKEISTTNKPVLVNRIKEAVRNTKTDKHLPINQSLKREKPKNNTFSSELDRKVHILKNSAKNKANEEEKNVKPKTRTRKTSLPSKNSLIENNNLKKKNLVNLKENIRRFDDDLPTEKLMNLNFNKEFLKGSFLKKSSTSEQGFKQEKSKNLNYHEEFIHQSKEQETIYSLPTIDRKQTIKPPIGLQMITQPSSPPPVAHKNQINLKFISKKPISINYNENVKNIKHKLDVLKQNDYPKIQQKVPYQNSYNGFNMNLNKPNPLNVFNNKRNPQPRLEKHLHKSFSTFSSPSEQQKKHLLQLLQANSVASNQIQRSMNINTGFNQLAQSNFNKNQRSSHIPKNQLIQHLQMLSNLNMKNSYPNFKNQHLLINPQQNQISPKFFELAQSMNAVPLPSMRPNQYTDMNQMIDVKIPPVAMNAATEHYQDDSMNNGNVFTESNDHAVNFNTNSLQNQFNNQNSNNVYREINLHKKQPISQYNQKNHHLNQAESNTNLQTAESIDHTHHATGENNLLSVADSSNSAVMNFNLKDPPNTGKGLHMSFGGGPSSGGAQLITNPMGIFKSLLLPLLPKPRMNLNGKVVFGVVLEKGVGFGKPKPSPPPVLVMPPVKHSFFG